MKKIFAINDKMIPGGLLLLRLGIGIMFMLHGYPKISGGTETWIKLGSVMELTGINFGYTYWGMLAAFAEFFGGLFLILGLLFRPAAFFMLFTMLMATVMHISTGDPIMVASHAIESGIVFFALIITGPGKYSLDLLLFNKKNK